MPGLLWGWRGVLAGLWCLAPQAGAAQVPPADFNAALFIDAGGCVRERSGTEWRPRLLADGRPDCGYPPTPLPPPLRRDADLPVPPGMPEAEGRLLAVMAEGLRPDDFLPPAPSPPPPALPGHPVRRAVESAISAEGRAARAVLAGARPNARLCDLIGERGGGAAGSPGGDPSRGFCPGDAPGLVGAALRPAAVLPARAPAALAGEGAVPAPTARGDRPPVAPVAASRGVPAPKPAAPPGPLRGATTLAAGAAAPAATTSATRGATATAARPAASVAKATPAAIASAPANGAGPRRASLVDERLIHAGARFLQLGGPVDAAGADARIVRIAALGLPVARGKVSGGDGVLVMAGPFDSRQAIVRAYARLRTAGFANITAR